MRKSLPELIERNINHPNFKMYAQRAFGFKDSRNLHSQMEVLMKHFHDVEFEFNEGGFPEESFHPSARDISHRRYIPIGNGDRSLLVHEGKLKQDRADFPNKSAEWSGSGQGSWNVVALFAKHLYSLSEAPPVISTRTPSATEIDEWGENKLGALRERFTKCSQLNRAKMIPIYEHMWAHCQSILDDEAKELDKLRGV